MRVFKYKNPDFRDSVFLIFVKFIKLLLSIIFLYRGVHNNCIHNTVSAYHSSVFNRNKYRYRVVPVLTTVPPKPETDTGSVVF